MDIEEGVESCIVVSLTISLCMLVLRFGEGNSRLVNKRIDFRDCFLGPNISTRCEFRFLNIFF